MTKLNHHERNNASMNRCPASPRIPSHPCPSASQMARKLPCVALAPAKAAGSATTFPATRQPCHFLPLNNLQSHIWAPLGNHLHANRHVISTTCSMPSHHARGGSISPHHTILKEIHTKETNTVFSSLKQPQQITTPLERTRNTGARRCQRRC